MKFIIYFIGFIIGFSVIPLYALGFLVAFTGRPYGVIIMFSGALLMLSYLLITIISPFINKINKHNVKHLRISLIFSALGILISFISMNIME